MKNQILIMEPSKSDQRYGVRVYAFVKSASRPQAHHVVVYVRKTGMRRWLCDCPAQLFIETGRRRNCKHIHAVRRKVNA